jgi:hypothetical protein
MRRTLSLWFLGLCLGGPIGQADPGRQQIENNSSPLKAVVFLSAFCPCSRSHVEHLNQLSEQYSDLQVFAVIADPIDASNEVEVSEYFSREHFQFPVLEDRQQDLLRKYQALKTPHVVLMQRQPTGNYKTLYEGGVSDHRDFSSSKKKFLAENLHAINNHQPLPYQQGRSLGCYIRRLQ